jgi:dihydrofolate reductase
MKKSLNGGVGVVTENAMEVVRKLKNEEGADIYLCGGGELATELFKEGLIDEVILKVNPLFLGSGIPLLHDVGRHIDLELIGSKVYSSGVVLLSYRVNPFQ